MAKSCRKCGAALKERAAFCGACGTAVLKETEVSEPKTGTETKGEPQTPLHNKKTENKKGLKPFIGVGIAAVVILGVAFAVIGKINVGSGKGLPVLGGSKENLKMTPKRHIFICCQRSR